MPAASPGDVPVRYGVLGSVELRAAGRTVPVGGPRQVALLAFLLTRANRAVSTDELLEALWRGEPGAGVGKVHVAVARLRRALGQTAGAAAPLRTLAGGYRLETGPGELDADVLAAGLRAGRLAAAEGDHAGAVERFDAALALWRGPPLADVGYEAFAQDEIRRLEELRLDVVETRADSLLALGRHEEVVRDLLDIAAAEPGRERLTGQLMLALYRCGRQGDALDAYQRTHRALVRELGLEPGPALKRLQQRILEQAADLEPVTAARHPPDTGPSPVPLPALLRAAAAEPFVGRREAREDLERCWATARAGRRTVAVVTGEAGIGKTALAAQVAETVRRSGATVLYGACEPTSVVPYHPVVTALREVLHHGPAPWRGDEWLDEVAAVLGLTTPPRVQDGGDDRRFWLFEGVRHMLDRLAERRPLLFVADDLHWADASTLQLLAHLVQEPSPSKLLLVATQRSDDASPGAAWPEGRARPAARIALLGLGHEETAQLVASRQGAAVTDELAARWHDRTGGHPFFLTALLARGGMRHAVPDTVRELILRRVGRLSDDTRRVLAAAAVAGREFGLDLVVAVTGLPPGACLSAVEEAMDGGLVAEVPDAPDRFRFAHALVRETLYEQFSRSRRVRVHAAVLGALEAAGAPAAELAHHAFEARHVVGHAPAVAHAELAAAAAATALAYEDAAAHLRQALAALEPVAGEDHRRCELLLALGEVQARAGEPTVDATFAAAVESARRRGDAVQLARAALAGRQSERAIRDDARAALLREAVDGLGDERPALRVDVLARLAAVLHFSDPAAALAVGEEAVASAVALDDPRALAAALNGRHTALMHADHVEERLAVLGRLRGVAERLGDAEVLAVADEWAIYALLELGDLERARAAHAGFAQVAAAPRQARFDHVFLAWKTVFAQLDGRLPEAEQSAFAAYEYAGRLHISDPDSLLASQLAFIRRDQGRLAEMLPVIESWVSVSSDRLWAAGLAIARAETGDEPGARAVLAQAGDAGFEDLPRDMYWLSTLVLFAEAGALVADDRSAAMLYRLLEPYGERHAQIASAIHLGSVHRVLGGLAAVQGRSGRAIEHLELALSRHRAAGAATLTHRTACALAAVLLRRNRPGDRRRAQRLLTEAVERSRSTAVEPLVSGLARAAGDVRQPARA